MSERPVSETLRILVAGRPLTIDEQKRWKRALGDPLSLLLTISVFLLFGTFLMQTAALAIEDHWLTSVFILPILGGCVAFFVLWFIRVQRRNRQAENERRRDPWHDEQAVRSGNVTAFYEDRLVHTTMRGSNTMFYDAVTVYCETKDGFAVGDGRFTVFLRAADLTAINAGRIRALLTSQLTPKVYRVKGTVQPQLEEPLYIPRFVNFDTVVTRASVKQPPSKKRRTDVLGLALAQWIVYGSTLALATNITPWGILDWMLVCPLAVVIGMLITVWMISLSKPKSVGERQVVFTKEGLAQQQNGVVWFTVRERYRQQQNESGVTLTFSDGEVLHIPWSAIQEPDKIREQIA